ncbi:hypothetical protein FOMPIDRAFT_1052568 [Fomitopsis schrenkii]|uniref:Uncharacterized protein n=1 Tax=Fomitopsis schrenkii TaxID=2126942 RepID=S8E1T1_FOMSC|nr:hypothetical protein FOMPIDRAFT_1052568 [Fomitopsis schrenkii]
MCRPIDPGASLRPSSKVSVALPVRPAFSASSLSASLSSPSIPRSSDVRHLTSFPTDVHPPLSQASPDVPGPLGSTIVPSASLLAAFTPLRLLVRARVGPPPSPTSGHRELALSLAPSISDSSTRLAVVIVSAGRPALIIFPQSPLFDSLALLSRWLFALRLALATCCRLVPLRGSTGTNLVAQYVTILVQLVSELDHVDHSPEFGQYLELLLSNYYWSLYAFSDQPKISM